MFFCFSGEFLKVFVVFFSGFMGFGFAFLVIFYFLALLSKAFRAYLLFVSRLLEGKSK